MTAMFRDFSTDNTDAAVPRWSRVNIVEGDCLTEMPKLAAESFDAVVTDPPYGMSFQSNRLRDERKKN